MTHAKLLLGIGLAALYLWSRSKQPDLIPVGGLQPLADQGAERDEFGNLVYEVEGAGGATTAWWQDSSGQWWSRGG